MRFKALIFDCDGTLTDSMPLHYRAWCEVMAPYGLKLSEERFYELAGVPTLTIIAQLASAQKVSLDHNKAAREKEAAFLGYLHLLKPIAAVTAIVSQNLGICKMAVASGGVRAVIERQLDLIGLAKAFDAIVTAEDTPRHKPEPDVFLEAARRLDCAPGECCVYEDADLGIEAAKRAGMAWVDIRSFHTPARVKK